MKLNRLFRILCAIVVLVLASLACNAAEPATPGVSNIYMANDEAGTNKLTTFAPTDDFYVFFDVNAVDAGTSFQSRWYALNIEGVDASTPVQTIDYSYEEGIKNIYFQLTNDTEWPVGDYKVEIYMNGAKVAEQAFNVQ